MNKIVVDAFGGDNSPNEIVLGAVLAVNKMEGFNVVLCGKEEIIKEQLSKSTYESSRIEILNATEVITNDDVPTTALRSKKDSSLVVGMTYLKETPEAVGFVSAGSTGAVLTTALFKLGRIDQVQRPALAPIFPTIKDTHVVMLDIGANIDCKPEYILQFAIMGACYMKMANGVSNPRVGLLSNGVEDKKGNALNKEVFKLLKEAKNINFVGNMEAREIISGDYDVVVTDGFAGNIALKAMEGAVLTVFKLMKKGIMSSFKAKMGALLLKGVFKDLKSTLDYNNNGGAVLLGVEKVLVKSHGSSKAPSICASILQCKELNDSEFVKNIKDVMKLEKEEKKINE